MPQANVVSASIHPTAESRANVRRPLYAASWPEVTIQLAREASKDTSSVSSAKKAF